MTKAELSSMALDTAKKWGFGTVLACAVLWWLSQKIDFLMEKAVPAHLQQIQEGYDRNAAVMKDAVRDVIAANEKEAEKRERQMERLLDILQHKVGMSGDTPQPGG